MAHPLATTTNRDGSPRYVAVLNGRTGKAKLVECNRCKEIVALVQSSRTGKWYTCEVYGYGQHGDLVKATPWAPHYKTCAGSEEARLARNAERRGEPT